LILEPHFDDAALSCAALLAREVPIDVVTVFAGEPTPPVRGHWDETCGFADSREALVARRAEQAAAFAGLPHRLSSLPVLERQYIERRTDADRATIASAVEEWAGQNPGGIVALPAGAGWRAPGIVRRLARIAGRDRLRPHAEHIVVRDAALAAIGAEWTPLLFEELPYLGGGRADRAAREAASAVGRRARLVEEQVDREAKARRVASYGSQLPWISPPGGRLDEPASLPGVERYWLLER
jgi:LmbE family N-acetylglucosaminyl deacetylase